MPNAFPAGVTFHAADSREIVELMLTIGQYLMLARVMTTLELEFDKPRGARIVSG